MNVNEEMNSRDESGDEFIPDIRPTQPPSIYHLVPHIEIKQEEMDFHPDSIAHSEDPFHLDLDTVPCNPLYVDCDSSKLNEFYSDLSHCEKKCETCQKYTKTLMKHVRSTHDPPQHTHDPLHIDPGSIDYGSPQDDPVQIKCEVDEHIDQKYCSQELDFQHNSASGAEDDSDRNLKPACVTGSTIPHDGYNSVQTEQKDMNEFNLDFLQRADAEDCETCQKYLRMLSEHARVSHAPPQPIRDPLLLDPLNIVPDPHHAEQSSSIEIKYEVYDDIEKMECSEQESESNDPDFVLESVSKSDLDDIGSTPVNGKVKGDSKVFANPGPNDSTTTLTVGEKEKSNQFKCNQCSKSLKTKKCLSVHMRIHTGERLLKCDVCEKSFSDKCRLSDHKRSHTGERPYQCDVCVKCFSSTRNLAEHRRRHGETPYKCGVCEKSLKSPSELTKHKRTHTGERPYQCDECKKKFSSSSDLTKHKTVHSGEKSYECRVCVKFFTRQDSLTRHNIRVHSGVRPYKCNECEESFKMLNHLTKHKRTQHNGD